jgi:hypothetical protein
VARFFLSTDPPVELRKLLSPLTKKRAYQAMAMSESWYGDALERRYLATIKFDGTGYFVVS